jgi:hypothetical protein
MCCGKSVLVIITRIVVAKKYFVKFLIDKKIKLLQANYCDDPSLVEKFTAY